MSDECSIKECEEGASNVYCPNRFTFHEMCNIGMALHIAPEVLESFKETANYDELDHNGKNMFDNAEKIIQEMNDLEEKVSCLLRMATK